MSANSLVIITHLFSFPYATTSIMSNSKYNSLQFIYIFSIFWDQSNCLFIIKQCNKKLVNFASLTDFVLFFSYLSSSTLSDVIALVASFTLQTIHKNVSKSESYSLLFRFLCFNKIKYCSNKSVYSLLIWCFEYVYYIQGNAWLRLHKTQFLIDIVLFCAEKDK